MADQQLIEQLIATYRTLNSDVRRLDEANLRVPGPTGTSARDAMRRFRDSELKFSQALKERVSGVPIPDLFTDEDLPTLGTETADDTTAMLIAQFGTARESTLAMLRDLPEPEWDAPREGDKTIRDRVAELQENDRRQLDRIIGSIATSASS
jgi:hypothetical protein